MSLTMAKKKSARGPGRPKKERQTESVSGRVWTEVSQALRDLADIRRRSVSAEFGMFAEDMILDAEEELRRAGKWNAALDRLKAERRGPKP